MIEVEDLLDRVAAEDARERGSLHDRHEHEQHHERAHVRRDEVVQRDAGRVRGEHRHVRDAARIRVAQDPVPAERGEHRLCTLEEAAEEDVADRDLGEGVPEALEPAEDVDPGEVERRERDEEPGDPRGDADDPAPRGVRREGRVDHDVGHRASLTVLSADRRAARAALRSRRSLKPRPHAAAGACVSRTRAPSA